MFSFANVGSVGGVEVVVNFAVQVIVMLAETEVDNGFPTDGDVW